MIEKSTELGVETIVPVQTARSEKGLELAAGKRVERWRKIARAASQQSHRVRPPEILAPLPLREAAKRTEPSRLYLEETPGSPLLLKAAPRHSVAAILIGPEGGWTDRERALLLASAWSPVSMGPQILP